MLNLTSSSDQVEVVTTANSNIQVHASYVDTTGPTSVLPGRTNTPAITTATTTQIVAGPTGASLQRNVKFISIYNGGLTQTISVQHTDGSNLIVLVSLSLLAGYTLSYNDLDGWAVTNANGAIVLSSTSPTGYAFAIAADAITVPQ